MLTFERNKKSPKTINQTTCLSIKTKRKIFEFANSINSDEPPHPNLHCLSSYLSTWYRLEVTFLTFRRRKFCQLLRGVSYLARTMSLIKLSVVVYCVWMLKLFYFSLHLITELFGFIALVHYYLVWKNLLAHKQWTRPL